MTIGSPMLEMFSLDGKSALVTGASRGIGAAVARAYSEAGAEVAVAARSKEALVSLADEIGVSGRRAIPIVCDVMNSDDIRDCVDQVLKEFGKIDVLVNNAGGTQFIAPLVETRDEGWHKSMRLNLDSVFYFCKAVGAHMLERRSGSVINVASIAAFRASPGAYYGAAKAGIVNLCRSLAVEWGPAGVRVNAICPGLIRTELSAKYLATADFSRVAERVPLLRWGEPDDVLGAAIWLASDASSYVTGTTIVIDGGLMQVALDF